MLKRALAAFAIILIALVGIYYNDMADFMRQDSCIDAGGVWRQQRQKCMVDRRQELPAWMAKYAVVEPETDLNGKTVANSVDQHP